SGPPMSAFSAQDSGGPLVSLKSGMGGPPMSPFSAQDSGGPPVPHRRGHRIGFIGRLDPIKRIGDLLHAMTFLDTSVHLSIYGEGPERARIEQSIGSLGLENRVMLHGAVAGANTVLPQLDLLVL